VPLGTAINYTVGAFSPPAFFAPPGFFGPPAFFSPPGFFGPPAFFSPPGFFVPPQCTSCTGSLNRTETVNSYCQDGCRKIVTRYYWNAPLCQPSGCSSCACPAYNDVVSDMCCACFGCY